MRLVKQIGDSRIVVEDHPEPTPGPGEVVIRTVVSAICGSEMHGYRGTGYATGNMGHEAAGIVAALGEGVDALQIGERIGVSAIAGCGHCPMCAEGRYTWCPNFRFIDNMHAEAFVIPALACHRLPDDVPWEVGVLITGDGLGVPYHTSLKLPESTQTVAVFGLGPIGLGNVLMQANLGRRVIGIDRFADRRDLALAMGAKDVLAGDDNTPRTVRALTDGKGADVCIEAAGVPITAKQCFAAVRTGGMVVFNGEQPAVELSPSEDFIRRDITAVGSWFYHFCEYPAMLALHRDGLDVASLVTHKFPIEQAAEAFATMQAGRSGKVLLRYARNAD